MVAGIEIIAVRSMPVYDTVAVKGRRDRWRTRGWAAGLDCYVQPESRGLVGTWDCAVKCTRNILPLVGKTKRNVKVK